MQPTILDWREIQEIGAFAPVEPPTTLVSTFVEQNRVMPLGTPFPGFWENERTPYLVEPMDNLGPYSSVSREIILKGAQMGFTAMIENIIGYYIKEAPCEILYITSNEDMLKKWAMKRLEPMIDSIGARKLFQAKTEKTRGKSGGDMTLLKLFIGGALNMASAQSGAGIRSDAIRLLVRDEISAAPILLRTKEGDWLAVSQARTAAWGNRAKVLDQSTPGIEGECAITKEYEHGDKRKFLVPCPHCGKHQELRWGNDHTQHGMKPDTKAGELIKAYYICEFCHDAFFNHHKTEILAKGRWEPSAKGSSPQIRSRQISGMYRPVGMETWTAMYQEYQKALQDPAKMPGFVNLELGKAYRPTGHRPPLKKVIELRCGYRAGTIPDGVLFLTMFVDVQEGSKKDKSNPPRLELEICGHGADFKTWSIMYKRIEGEVLDPEDGAWTELDDWAHAGGMTFLRDDGRQFDVILSFIDSGDLSSVVYQFCRRWENTYPTKGRRWVRAKKHENPDLDEAIPSQDYRRFSPSRLGDDTILYIISTIFYKDKAYMNFQVPKQDTGEERRGFCSFPYDYDDRYFEMLTSEDKLADGSYHSGGRRNEALDCRVGNLCACDVYLKMQIEDLKLYYRQHDWTKFDCDTKIDHKFVLELMTASTAKKLTA